MMNTNNDIATFTNEATLALTNINIDPDAPQNNYNHQQTQEGEVQSTMQIAVANKSHCKNT